MQMWGSAKNVEWGFRHQLMVSTGRSLRQATAPSPRGRRLFFGFHCTPSFVFAVTVRSCEGVSQCARGKELYRRVVETPGARWVIPQGIGRIQ